MKMRFISFLEYDVEALFKKSWRLYQEANPTEKIKWAYYAEMKMTEWINTNLK